MELSALEKTKFMKIFRNSCFQDSSDAHEMGPEEDPSVGSEFIRFVRGLDIQYVRGDRDAVRI